jgi:hypothetical protein
VKGRAAKEGNKRLISVSVRLMKQETLDILEKRGRRNRIQMGLSVLNCVEGEGAGQLTNGWLE